MRPKAPCTLPLASLIPRTTRTWPCYNIRRRTSDASAPLWVLPGWESCPFDDWVTKGSCFRQLHQVMKLSPPTGTTTLVLATSRPNRWALGHKHRFIYDNPHYKITVENNARAHKWVTVPYISMWPFSPWGPRDKVVACIVGYRPHRRKTIEECKTTHGVLYSLPNNANGLYSHSTFSLHPTGDTYTRRAIFDALSTGNIPIIFHRKSFDLYTLPFERANNTVLLCYENMDVKSIVKRVMVIDDATINKMRDNIVRLKHHLFYSTLAKPMKADALTMVLSQLSKSLTKTPAIQSRFWPQTTRLDAHFHILV